MKLILRTIFLTLICLGALVNVAQEVRQAAAGDSVNATLDSLFSEGMVMISEGRSVEAGAVADQLLQWSRARESRSGMAGAYYLLGRISELEEDLPDALRNYFIAVREYEWTTEEGKLAETLARMGDIYRNSGVFSKAAEYYARSRRVLKDEVSLRKLMLEEKLAGAYFLMEEYDSALALYKHLLPAYIEERPDLAQVTLMQITSCLYQLERYAPALPYNEMALELARERQEDSMAEIEALNSLGYNYKYLAQPEEAVELFNEAANLAEVHFRDRDIYTVTLVNLAIAWQNAGETGRSLDIFFQALKVAEEREDMAERSRIAHLISHMYYLQKDYYNAGEYNELAVASALAPGNDGLLMNAYQMASLISTALYDYEAGMMYYRKYLSLRDSLQTAREIAFQGVAEQEYAVERTEKELSALLYERELQGMELKNLRIEGEKKQQELELLRKTAELQDAAIRNQELEKNRALQELLLAEEKLAAERKDREIEDLKVEQQLQESELKRRELEQIRQEQEIEVLTTQRELDELTIQKVRARNAFLAGIVLLAIIILVLLVRMLRYARKTNRTLSEQRNKIQQQKEAIEDQYEIIKNEREKSDRLLLNILPEQTANELKEKGRAVPKQYEKVTVLFTDFVGFTMVAEKMTPEELVRELDECFMEFDRIIGAHNLEKIKTIGDAYMCAGGIPVANESNPYDAVEAALEIKAFMDRMRQERLKQGREYWQLRIGIHTGEVVAGVVGRKKFAYDIWGDAVNTASRMESSGEPGKVNISGSTYALVRDRYACTYRGKVHAKNKGEIDMYFVNGQG